MMNIFKKIAVVFTLAFLLGTLAGKAFAKDKKVYDQTGTVAYSSFNSNAEAHMTVNGERHDAYCNVDDHSADCTTDAGVFVVVLADGRKTVVRNPDLEWSNGNGNPVLESLKGTKTFQYRLTTLRSLGKKTPFFCVADGSKEDCYEITAVRAADPAISGK
jgi:hypothetical protein